MTDFAGIRYAADPNVELKEGYNEWGIKRETFDPTGENMGQVKDFPLAEDWHLLKNYPLPDFSKESRYEHLEEQVEAGHARGKYVYGPIPTLMQTPADLRGMDNWFMDHILIGFRKMPAENSVSGIRSIFKGQSGITILRPLPMKHITRRGLWANSAADSWSKPISNRMLSA